MSIYKFNLKKEDITLEFYTSDKLFFSQEMDKWIEDIANLPETVKVESEEKQTSTKKPTSKKTPKQDINEIIIPVNEEAPITAKKIKAAIAEEEKVTSQKAKPNTSKADANEFLEVLQEKFKSIPDVVSEKIAARQNLSEEADNSSFKEFLSTKKQKNLLDYLVLTAYYLKEFELMDRYSLKQINSRVMSITNEPIDHAVIQEAVENDYLEIVPDYTGMAGVTEYRLTNLGEDYLINEL